jgi:hypothetical protein
MEIDLLKTWVMLGADFSKTVNSLNGQNQLQKILSSKKIESDELNEEVTAADGKIIGKLKKYNVVVVPIAEGNNHLSINLINAQSVDSAILLLPSLGDQLVWLSASSAKISDSHLETISKLKNLRKLDLRRSSVSETGLARLSALNNLTSLNLSETSVDLNAIKSITVLPKLKEVFLFHTKVSEAEAKQLRKNFTSIVFETGNYSVPTLASDTTLVKKPK